MNKTRIIFFVLLGAFGLLAGLAVMPAFAVEKGTKVTRTGKVDVNNATEQELEALPGVGAVYAKKIIDGRPYKTKADLVRAGIPQSTVDKIKNTIKFGKVKTTKAHVKTHPKATSKATKHDMIEGPAKVPPHRGMVWVNKDTMIYHTEGDQWYGRTEHGEFMTEKDAIKFGARISKQD